MRTTFQTQQQPAGDDAAALHNMVLSVNARRGIVHLSDCKISHGTRELMRFYNRFLFVCCCFILGLCD